MVSNGDVFEIGSQHYRVISVLRPDIRDDIDEVQFELSSLHNPNDKHLIMREEEVREHEKVDDVDNFEYLINHAEKLVKAAERAKENLDDGNLSEFRSALDQLDMRRKHIRRQKREIEDQL